MTEKVKFSAKSTSGSHRERNSDSRPLKADGYLPKISQITAIRTATPLVTCSKIAE